MPSVVGLVEKVTVRAVAVADVTVPMAPLLNVTVLLDAVVLKPEPLMVTVAAFAPMVAELSVTIGVILATRMGAPLLTPFVETTAVNTPAEGLVENRTVSAVEVAEITVPIAPLLSVTVLFSAVVSKPTPLIVTVVSLKVRLPLLIATVGLIVATCTAVPLLTEFVVTTAVRFPTDVGLVEKVTVNDVAVDAVTVPTAPLLNATVLFAAVALNPKPLNEMVFTLIV